MTEPSRTGPSKTPIDPVRRGKKIQLHLLAIARSDVSSALAAAKLLLDLKPSMNEPLYHALVAAVVVAYGRPFKQSEPHDALPARWSRFSTPRAQKTHDGLIASRDKQIAHSDWEVRNVLIMPAGATIRGYQPETLTVAITSDVWPLGSFPRIIEHFEELIRRLDDEANLLLEELFGGVAGPTFPLDPEDGL